MDDLRDRLAHLAQQAAQRAQAPGATLTLRRARARRRWAAGVGLCLLLLGLAGVTSRLVADRKVVNLPAGSATTVPGTTTLPGATPRQAAPLWTAKAATPATVRQQAYQHQAAGDVVVVATGVERSGRVGAYDARTGRLRWTRHTGGVSIMAVGERHVIVAPQYGALIALDLATGEERWRFPLSPRQSSEHGTIVGDSLYIGTSFPGEGAVDAPVVYSLELATGGQRWRAVLDSGTDLEWGAPVVENGLVLVADTLSHSGSAPASHLHALDAGTGQGRWKADLHSNQQGFHNQRPIVAGGTVVVMMNTSGTLLGLAADSGRELWRQRLGEKLRLLVGVKAGLIVAALEGGLVAFEVESGDRRWEAPVPRGRWATEPWAVLAEGTVYVAAGGHVGAFSVATGAVRWRAATGQAIGPPVTAGARLYVATGDRLVALDAISGRAAWVSANLEIAIPPVATQRGVAITTRDGALLGFAP
jgi:outer membrane protein assembly factor BamB